MSKKDLKAALKGLDRDQLTELILEVYSKIKEAKKFLDFYADPDEEKLAEEIKAEIFSNFFSRTFRRKKIKLAPAKRMVSNFAKLGVSPHLVLDVMIYMLEMADAAYHSGYRFTESFFDSMQKNYEAAQAYAEKHDLYDAEIKERLEDLSKEGYF
ncbi:MAG: DUF6155 family protein [Muribaculaceae bacterium]